LTEALPVTRALIIFFAVVAISGCSATYEEKSDYLELVAQRGVETHKLIEDRGREEANDDVCNDAHVALNQDYPEDSFLASSEEWENLVRETFVGACVSGRY
jgi:hypothetical protein